MKEKDKDRRKDGTRQREKERVIERRSEIERDRSSDDLSDKNITVTVLSLYLSTVQSRKVGVCAETWH